MIDSPSEAQGSPLTAKEPSPVSLHPPEKGRPQWAMAFLEALGWKRHQAAAIVAQGIWESGGPKKGGPSEWDIITTALGDAGTAHGGWQWRGDRYIGPNGLLHFAYTKCPGQSSAFLDVQLKFVDWELTKGNERRVGVLLRAAETVEQATKAFIQYLRPAYLGPSGTTLREHPELGHGYEKRLKLAHGLL